MAIDYQALKTELAGSHPVSGAYNADDQLAADQLNAYNIAAPASSFSVLEYCFTEKYRTGPAEGAATQIYGRIAMLAGAAVGSDPYGIADSVIPTQVGAAATFLRMLQDQETLDLGATHVDEILDRLSAGNAMGPNDKTALIALMDNKINRLEQIDFGRLKVNATHVAHARAI